MRLFTDFCERFWRELAQRLDSAGTSKAENERVYLLAAVPVIVRLLENESTVNVEIYREGGLDASVLLGQDVLLEYPLDGTADIELAAQQAEEAVLRMRHL